MFILQRPPCRVNVQTTYIFQLFFERSAKSPRGRVLLGAGWGGIQFYGVVLVSSKPMAT